MYLFMTERESGGAGGEAEEEGEREKIPNRPY